MDIVIEYLKFAFERYQNREDFVHDIVFNTGLLWYVLIFVVIVLINIFSKNAVFKKIVDKTILIFLKCFLCIILAIVFLYFLFFGVIISSDFYQKNLEIKQAKKEYPKDKMLKTEKLNNFNLSKIKKGYKSKTVPRSEEVLTLMDDIKNKYHFSTDTIVKINNSKMLLFAGRYYEKLDKGYTNIYEYDKDKKSLSKLGWIPEYYINSEISCDYKNFCIIYKSDIFTTDGSDEICNKMKAPIIVIF